jgi:hypothetical protein
MIINSGTRLKLINKSLLRLLLIVIMISAIFAFANTRVSNAQTSVTFQLSDSNGNLISSVSFQNIAPGTSKTVSCTMASTNHTTVYPYWNVTNLPAGDTLNGYWNGPEVWNINTGRMWNTWDTVTLKWTLTVPESNTYATNVVVNVVINGVTASTPTVSTTSTPTPTPTSISSPTPVPTTSPTSTPTSTPTASSTSIPTSPPTPFPTLSTFAPTPTASSPTISPSPSPLPSSNQLSGIISVLTSGFYFFFQPFLLLLYVFIAFLILTLKRKSYVEQIEIKLGVKNAELFVFSIYLLELVSVSSIFYPFQMLGLVVVFLGIILATVSFYYSPKRADTNKVNALAIFGGALLLAGLAIYLYSGYYWLFPYQSFGVVLFVTGIFLSALVLLYPPRKTELELQTTAKIRKCPMCNYEINDEKAESCPRCGESLSKGLKSIKTTKLRFVGGSIDACRYYCICNA